MNRCDETRLFITMLISTEGVFGGRGEAAWQGGGARDLQDHKHSCVCLSALLTSTHCCWESLPQTAARDAVLVIHLLR